MIAESPANAKRLPIDPFMHVPLGNVFWAGGAGMKLYKWWHRRREKVLRASRRRQFLRDGLLTCIAIAGAVLGMVLLTRAV
jgi:hypothetical protein